MTEQSELWEELKVENHWFHVVRAMIQRDKIAEMGVHAWAVYCVLKSYAALDTGRSFPGRDAIARHVGVSLDTVDRALSKLADMGIVSRRKAGRKNIYELTEHIPMTTATGEIAAHGEARYIPMQFQQVLDELKAFAAKGSLPGGVEIKIVLNANFLTGEHATVNNFNAPTIVGAEVIPKPSR